MRPEMLASPIRYSQSLSTTTGVGASVGGSSRTRQIDRMVESGCPSLVSAAPMHTRGLVWCCKLSTTTGSPHAPYAAPGIRDTHGQELRERYLSPRAAWR